MSNAIAEGQAANILPPVQGKIIAITLDATSRAYDLGALSVGDYPLDAGGELFITLYGDVKFYYFMSDVNTGTVDETAKIAAGAAQAFTANAAWEIPASTPEQVRINRKLHRYLVVKGSGAGVLRVRASSESSGRR